MVLNITNLNSTHIVKSLMGTGLAESLVGGEFGFILGDFTRWLGSIHLHHGNDGLGLKRTKDRQVD